MSNNTKQFRIVINGVTESVDAVKSLNEQLKECEGIIDRLKNAEINIKVSGGDNIKTPKVSGGNRASDSDKLSLDIEKEITKQLDMQNESLREQYIERERLKNENKEELDTIKQQAKGYADVVDGVKVYANTMQGMSAHLKDIKRELRNTDLDSDEFKKLTQDANELNEKLKQLEGAYGQFGRNVGNYTNSIKEALESWDGLKDFSVDMNINGVEGSLNDLKQQLKELKDYWANLSPDDANFDKTSNAIKSLTNQINDMESSLKDVGAEANSTFTGRFTTTIGGVEASFSNASEACEALRKKLVAMRVAGEQNTPMYQEIIQLVRRLSKEVQTAQKEIAGMNSTTANMGKIIGVMRGLSGIASLGQGIAGLFGGASEDFEKFMKSFASITLVIGGLKELQETIQSGDGAFGEFAQNFNKRLDKIISPLTNLSNATKDIINLQDAMSNLAASLYEQEKSTQHLEKLGDYLRTATNDADELSEVLNKMPFGDEQWADADILEEFNGSLERLKNKYPELNDEIDEYIRLCKEADKSMIESQKSLDEYQAVVDKLGPKTKAFATGLASLGKFGKAAAVGLNLVATSIKALSKALVVTALLTALAKALEWVGDGAANVWSTLKQFFGIIKESDVNKLTNDLDAVQRKLDSISKEYDIQVKLGNLGEVESQLQKLKDELQSIADMKSILDAQSEMAEWMGQLQTELDETDSAWKKLTKTEQNAAKAMQTLSKLKPSFFTELKNLSPEKQLEAIEKALGGDLSKLGDLEAILGQDDKAIEKFLDKLSDIDRDLNDIGASGVKQFGRLVTAINNARNSSANAVQKIKADLKSLQDQNIQLRLQLDATDFDLALAQALASMKLMAAQYGIEVSEDGMSYKAKKGDKNGEAIAKQMEENAKIQKQITEKQVKDAKKRKEEEDKREKEDAKKKAKEANTRLRNEINLRIQTMNDGYDKELAELKQKRKEELEDAADTGKSITTINQYYDKLELDLKKKYVKQREDILRDHNDRLMDIELKFLEDWKAIQRQIEDSEADMKSTQLDNADMVTRQNISYDLGDTDAARRYYDELRNAQIHYIDEREKLDIEASQRERERQLQDEKNRYDSLVRSNELALDEQKRAIKELAEQGKISQTEADTQIAELVEAYTRHEEEQLTQHYDLLKAIYDRGEEELVNIHLNAENERKQATIESLDNQRSEIENFYNSIDKVMQRTQKSKTNEFGFIDYESYRKSLKDALDATKKTALDIEEQKSQLQRALDNNEISFDDFKNAEAELDEFAEEVKDKTKELTTTLKNSFNTWLGDLMKNINQYAQIGSQMFSVLDDMYNRKLDAQQEAIDKEQELLDKELEMIEKNLEKQEEITEKHKDKISDVEGELSEARGDRREALIDQLAAERKAAEESIREEQRLTEEKKKQAQKQEQIEKQQQALDKKRKQQEKRAAIVQATINTFTAVSNALAVQPWFLGLALSGVALGLGMANVAQISAQKYADGGIIQGKRHYQGGVKVLGGQAEVEGGEYITNRKSTSANLPLLEYINSNRRTLTKDDLVRFYDNGKTTLINRQMVNRFEEGGQLPQLNVDAKQLIRNAQQNYDNRPIQVEVVEIMDKMNSVREVQTLAGEYNN